MRVSRHLSVIVVVVAAAVMLSSGMALADPDNPSPPVPSIVEVEPTPAAPQMPREPSLRQRIPDLQLPPARRAPELPGSAPRPAPVPVPAPVVPTPQEAPEAPIPVPAPPQRTEEPQEPLPSETSAPTVVPIPTNRSEQPQEQTEQPEQPSQEAPEEPSIPVEPPPSPSTAVPAPEETPESEMPDGPTSTLEETTEPPETSGSPVPSETYIPDSPSPSPSVPSETGQPTVPTVEQETRSSDQPDDESIRAPQSSTTTTESEAPVTVVPPEPPRVAPETIREVLAKEPIVEESKPVSDEETVKLYDEIVSVANRQRDDHAGLPDGEGEHNRHEWDGNVRPWHNDLIRYDHPQLRGPVFCNPYDDREIRIIYFYQGHRYVRVIPPRQTLFVDVDVRVHDVYSFTAVHVRVGGGVIVDVNVGTFHPWGYTPPVYTDVRVVVAVNNYYYPNPFVVRKVVDCGYDESRHKWRAVFDDGYVVWGRWVNTGLVREFHLEESATYPGLPGTAAEIIAAPPEAYVPAAQPQAMTSQTNDVSEAWVWALAGGSVVAALAAAVWIGSMIRRRGSHSI